MMTPDEFADRQLDALQLKDKQKRLDAEAHALNRERRHHKGLVRRAEHELFEHTHLSLANRKGARVANALMTRLGYGSAFVGSTVYDLANVVLGTQKTATAFLAHSLATEFRLALALWTEGGELQKIVNADPWFDRMLSMVLCNGTGGASVVVLGRAHTIAAHTMMRVMARLRIHDLNLHGVIFEYLCGPLLPDQEGQEGQEGQELNQLSGSLDLSLAVLAWCWNVKGWMVRAEARPGKERVARLCTEALYAADLAQIVWGLLNPSGPMLECLPDYLPPRKAPSKKRARE